MAAGTTRTKILLIDDEPFMRWTIRQVLAELGMTEVREAGDVPSGLDATLRFRPDIVFCDIHMPGDDGFAYLKAVREQPSALLAATPVIMLTAEKSTAAVVSAKRLKANGYIAKPISIDAIRKTLDRVLASRAGA